MWKSASGVMLCDGGIYESTQTSRSIRAEQAGVYRLLSCQRAIGRAAEMLRNLSGGFSAVTVNKDKMRLARPDL
jgi:hypothetical protein